MISFPVIIPVKTFDLAKRRLSGILQPPERAALARTMLIDVLNVVTSVVLPSNVIVITSSPEASGIARVRARRCCRRQLRQISTRQSKQPQDM